MDLLAGPPDLLMVGTYGPIGRTWTSGPVNAGDLWTYLLDLRPMDLLAGPPGLLMLKTYGPTCWTSGPVNAGDLWTYWLDLRTF